MAWARFAGGPGGRLRLVARAEEGLAEATDAGSEWIERVRTALRPLRRRVPARRPVSLIVPPHLVLTRRIETPAVDATRRREIVAFEAQRSLPFALDEVAWGWAPAGDGAVMLCAAKRDAIEALCTAIEDAGFFCGAAIPGPAALLAAARITGELAPGTLLLHHDGRAVTLAQAGDGRIDFRSFVLGASTPASPEQASDEWNASVSDFGREVKRSIARFQQGPGAACLRRVRLTGPAAPNRADELAAMLGVPVAASELGNGLAADGTGIVTEGNRTGLALLLGAAAGGRSGETREVDLLPAIRRRAVALRRRQPWLVLAAALAALTVTPPVVREELSLRTLRASNAANERRLERLRPAARRAREANERRTAAVRESEVWREVDRRRQSWRDFCADLESRLQATGDVWLEGVQLEPVDGTGRGPNGTGEALRLRVTGWLLDRTRPGARPGEEAYRRAGELFTNLGASPYLRAVEHEQFDRRRDGLLGFSAVLVTNPGRL